jgi:hypothetical protein
LPAAGVVDWWLLRSTPLNHPVGVLGLIAAGCVAVWLLGLVFNLWTVARGWKTIGEVLGPSLLLAGLSLAVGGGLVNWAWSLQGYVVLEEGDTMPLHHGTHSLALAKGPFADLNRLQITLQLVELELHSTEEGATYPESTLRIRGRSGKVQEFVVTPWNRAEVGDLRFYQGAYGFSPRIVMLKGEETLFDDVVPFTTGARGPAEAVQFKGRVELEEEEGIVIEGEIDTSVLDEAMRGHVALALQVRSDDRLLGAGRLLPGRFAELADGYRVGFAGLEQWSEIDFSRRNYRRLSLIGFAVALLGIVWIVSRVLWKRVGRGRD